MLVLLLWLVKFLVNEASLYCLLLLSEIST